MIKVMVKVKIIKLFAIKREDGQCDISHLKSN